MSFGVLESAGKWLEYLIINHPKICTYRGFSKLENGKRVFKQTACQKCSNNDTQIHYRICYCRQQRKERTERKSDQGRGARPKDNHDKPGKKQKDDRGNKGRDKITRMKQLMDESGSSEDEDEEEHYSNCLVINSPSNDRHEIQVIEPISIFNGPQLDEAKSSHTKVLIDSGSPMTHISRRREPV